MLSDLAEGAALVHDELEPPPGCAVVVFGCDGVGLGAVLAACDRGCHPIVVVDEDTSRLLTACELGATHAIDPGWDDPVAAIRSLRARGVHYAVDTTGEAPLEACLAPRGRVARPAPALPLPTVLPIAA